MKKYVIVLLIGILTLVLGMNAYAAETDEQASEQGVNQQEQSTSAQDAVATTQATKSGIDKTLSYTKVPLHGIDVEVDRLDGVIAYYNEDGKNHDCKEYVDRYYMRLYGTKNVPLVATKNPKKGDVVYASAAQRPTKGYPHYAIVKSYDKNNGFITLIEQNWYYKDKSTGIAYGAKERTIPFYYEDTSKNNYSVMTPVSNASSLRFSDVKEDYWAYSYIESLADLGILDGKTGTTFCPEEKITRAEFSKILFVLANAKETSYQNKTSFSDVSKSAWYAAYVEWAYKNGIVEGDNGQFRPDDNISRQEMAVMLSRYTKYAGKTLPENTAAITFKDSKNIASWAKDAVAAMQRAGVIDGYTDDKGVKTFKPSDNARRSEAAKMVSVFRETIK